MQILTRLKIWKTGGAVFVAVIFLLPIFSFAEEQSQLQLSEQKIKAGLIYNFLKYTEWPLTKTVDTSAPLVICVYGAEDPFDGYLQPIEERTVNQRIITIRHISNTEQMASCHMLFLGSDEQAQWPALHSFLANKSVLTVGDFTGFTNAGGMIELTTEDNRVQIQLNIESVAAAHLHIYDSLRRLAKTTQPSSRGGAE